MSEIILSDSPVEAALAPALEVLYDQALHMELGDRVLGHLAAAAVAPREAALLAVRGVPVMPQGEAPRGEAAA